MKSSSRNSQQLDPAGQVPCIPLPCVAEDGTEHRNRMFSLSHPLFCMNSPSGLFVASFPQRSEAVTAPHGACAEPPEHRARPLPSACAERAAETGLARNVLTLFSADASAAKAKRTLAVGKAGGRQRRGRGSVFRVAALE